MKYWWKNLTTDQRIALVFFSTLSLSGTVVTLLAPPDARNYFALATASFVFLLFERISRLNFEKKVMDGFNAIARTHGDLKNIGGISAGIDWFKRNNRNLKLVRNTVFTRSDTESFVLNYADLESAIRQALRDGCEWRDLYSAGEEAAVKRFHDALNSAERGHYSASRLDADVPLMQIMLLSYHEPRKVAVLYGWSHAGGREIDSQVYLSQDLSTFLFFDRYFDALNGKAEKTIAAQPVMPASKPSRSLTWFR